MSVQLERDGDGVAVLTFADPQVIASELFDTDDLQLGIGSFLADGPGKATFTGN